LREFLPRSLGFWVSLLSTRLSVSGGISMLRSSRTVVSLLGSLLMSTATTTTATVLVATTLVGCQDESQPEYWVEKLSDAAWKARAVKRLEQFFEDAVTKNGNDIKAQGVQDLINKTVEPLTKTYVTDYDTLDSKTRVSLIKLLASYRDKRTEPALKKAFDEFAKKPATAKDESDVKWAAKATGDLKLESLAVPMVEAFAKFRASTMLGGVTYKDYLESMLDMPSKAWVGPQRPDRSVQRPAILANDGRAAARHDRRSGGGRAADEGHAGSEQGRRAAHGALGAGEAG
jgi:hypothetical protein